jgi:hypothetical protein
MAAAAVLPFIGPVSSLLSSILGFGSASKAADQVAQGNQNAMHGVLGAAANGQTGVSDAARMGIQGVESAIGQGAGNLNAAGQQAIQGVNDATGQANTSLQQMLGNQTEAINPFLQAGQAGLTNLQAMAGGPGFSFNYEDYANDPAFQFQLEQGQKAITNSGSSRGLGSSGAVMKELANFGTGLAATHYGEAFNRAKDQFTTNQNAGLANNSALIGAGATGLGQYNAAQMNAGNQIAGNTIGAGKYAGDTMTSIQSLLAKMGLDASQFNAQTGLNAATTNSNTGLRAANIAGDYAVGSGNANASGTLGKSSAMSGGLSSIADILKQLLGGG